MPVLYHQSVASVPCIRPALFRFLGLLLFILIALLAQKQHAFSQVLWQENFSGLNQGWTAPIADSVNCGGNIFFGVRNGRFEANDSEGRPCCSATATTGSRQSTQWITNPINIAGRCNVAIDVSYGFIDRMECIPNADTTPYRNCQSDSNLPISVDNSHDQIIFEYSVDGGPWIMFEYVCGEFPKISAVPGRASARNIKGSTLRIRINPSCTANAEIYWFDDVTVLVGTSIPPPVSTSQATFCAGKEVRLTATVSGTGQSVQWYTTANGGNPLGAANTSFIVPAPAVPAVGQSATYYAESLVTGTNGARSCTRTPVTFTIVNSPTVNYPDTIAICSGSTATFPNFPVQANVSYAWQKLDNIDIGPVGNSGNGNIASFPVATVTQRTVSLFSVTPRGTNCDGKADTFRVVVYPQPTVTSTASCVRPLSRGFYRIDLTTDADSIIAIGALGRVLNTVSQGGGRFRVNDIPTTTNSVRIIVINKRSGCSRDIAVNAPDCTCPAITAPTLGPAPTAVCVGNPSPLLSATPGANQVIDWYSDVVIATPLLTGSSTYTPPPLTASTTFFVAARDTTLGCSSQRLPIEVLVVPRPVLDPVADQVGCANATIMPRAFLPNNVSVTWVNNNASTGLGASGTGNLPNFTATGAGVSRITVTPSASGCAGTPVSFNLTINPAPTFTLGGSACPTLPSTVYNIPVTTQAGVSISVSSGGTVTGSAPNFVLEIPTTQANLVVTARNANGCISTQTTGPAFPCACPTIDAPTSAGNPAPICAGGAVPPLTVNSTHIVDWFATPTGGLVLLTGNTFNPPSNISTTTTYYAEARLATGNCRSATRTPVTITVRPIPVVNAIRDTAFCIGSPTSPIVFTGTSGATFSWTNDQSGIGLAASGTGNIPVFTMNTGSTTANIVVTPTLNGCTGTPASFRIRANPQPTLSLANPTCPSLPSTTYNLAVTTNGTITTSPVGTVAPAAGGFTVSNLPVGTNTIVTARSAVGCTAQATANSPMCNCPTLSLPVLVGQPPTLCSGTTAPTIRVTVGTGESANWYTNPAGTSGLVASSTLTFQPSVVIGVDTLYVEAFNTTTRCASARLPIIVTVNETPTLSAIRDTAVCTGSAVPSIRLSATPTGSTINWTNNNTAIGLSTALGVGDVPNFTAANVTNRTTATISVTATRNGCTSAPRTFTIGVNPLPTLTLGTPACSAIPSTEYTVPVTSDAVNVTASVGNISGSTPNFTISNIPTTGGVTVTATNNFGCRVQQSATAPACNCPAIAAPIASGTVSPVCEGSANPTLSVQSVATGLAADWYAQPTGGTPVLSNALTFTPSGTLAAGDHTFYAEIRNATNTCRSTRTAIVITVRALPQANMLRDTTICSESALRMPAFTGTTGTAFTWANSNPAIGLAASGTGNLPLFNIPALTTDQTATIRVTPTLNGCAGTVRSFTITAVQKPTFTIGTPTCPVRPSNFYNVLVTLGGRSEIRGDTGIMTPATQGFLFTNVPTSRNLGLTFSRNGCVIRESVTAPNCSCPTVPAPTNAANASLCTGTNTAPILSASVLAGHTIDWYAAPTGGTPLARDTVQFRPTLPTTTTIYYAEARDRVTGCVSSMRTPVTLTITPTPIVTPLGDLGVCAGDTIARVLLGGTPGATYTWINSNPTIGLAAAGTGNIGAFRTPNLTTTAQANVIVNASLNGCTARPDTFTITINVKPIINASVGECSRDLKSYIIRVNAGNNVTISSSVGTVNVSSNIATISNIPTGTNPLITASNSGCLAQQAFNSPACPCPSVSSPTQPISATICLGATPPPLRVTVGADQTADWYPGPTGDNFLQRGTTAFSYTIPILTAGTYTVYAEARDTINGCRSSSRIPVVLTVNAVPDLVKPADRITCGGDSIQGVNFGGFVGATFTWRNDNPNIGLPATGRGNISTFVAPNSATVQNARIEVTPSANGCTGNAQAFNIQVKPSPLVDSIAPQRLCTGSQLTITLSSPTPNTTFNWTNNSDSLGIARSGTGNVLNITTANIVGKQRAALSVRGTANGCTGPQRDFTVFVGARTTESIVENTCQTTLGGTQRTDVFRNVSGCDSTVIRRFIFDPTLIDSTRVTRNTCDPAQAGTTFQRLVGNDGCDSILIVNTVSRVSAIRNVAETTCDPTKAGRFTDTYRNTFGCDSVVVRTVTFDPSRIDTTRQRRTVCDPSLAGVASRRLIGSDGCDSVLLITSVYRPADTTRLSSLTCDPLNNNRITTQRLRNVFGCDSIILTTFRFDPRQIDTTRLQRLTCDASQIGNPLIQRITRGTRCDSVVITNFILARRDSVVVRTTTCKPSEAGTFRERLTNVLGCDSVVVRAVTFDPRLIDTVRVSATTCDTTTAGTRMRTLQGRDGCDSIVITTTTYAPLMCPAQLRVLNDSVGCANADNGRLTLNIARGQPPFQYAWSSDNGASGNGRSPDYSPVSLLNLSPGTYTIIVTTGNGQISQVVGKVLAPDPISIRLFNPRPVGTHDVKCHGDATGTLRANIRGGTPSYTLRWSTNSTADSIVQLAAGTYTLTVTDRKGCTEVSTRRITEPLPLDPGVSIQPFICGVEALDAVLHPSGGQRPYSVSINGSPVATLRPALTPGRNTLQVIDARGCTTDTTITIDLPIAPVVVLPPDTIVLPGTRLTLTAQTNLNNWQRIEWKPTDVAINRDTLRQTFTPDKTISVVVTLIDSVGCIVRDTMLVIVQNKINLYVPNIFTPDGDGNNDRFVLGADPTVEALTKVAIYTRWGDMVYYIDQPTPVENWEGWDGSAHGRPALPGVYVYYLTVLMSNGETVLLKGDVMLVR